MENNNNLVPVDDLPDNLSGQSVPDNDLPNSQEKKNLSNVSTTPVSQRTKPSVQSGTEDNWLDKAKTFASEMVFGKTLSAGLQAKSTGTDFITEQVAKTSKQTTAAKKELDEADKDYNATANAIKLQDEFATTFEGLSQNTRYDAATNTYMPPNAFSMDANGNMQPNYSQQYLKDFDKRMKSAVASNITATPEQQQAQFKEKQAKAIEAQNKYNANAQQLTKEIESLKAIKTKEMGEYGIDDAFMNGMAQANAAINIALKAGALDSAQLEDELERIYVQQLSQPEGKDGIGYQAVEMIGGQVAPILATTGASFATGGLGTVAVATSMYGTMGYGNNLMQGYIQSRQQGMTPNESLAKAQQFARVGAATGAIEGSLAAINPFMKAGGLTNKTLTQGVKTALTDAGIDGAVAMGMQLANNKYGQSIGFDIEDTDGVLEQGAGEVAFSLGINALFGGTAKLNPQVHDMLVRGLAKSDVASLQTVVDKAVSEGVIDAARGTNTMKEIITTKQAYDKIPDEVGEDIKEEVLPDMMRKVELEKQLEAKDDAFKPAIEAEIETVNRKIQEDTGAPLTIKEQKAYEALQARKGDSEKPLTPSEKSDLKHFEKREKKAVKLAEKKSKEAENIEAEAELEVEPQEQVEVTEQVSTETPIADEAITETGTGTNATTEGATVEAVDAATPDNAEVQGTADNTEVEAVATEDIGMDIPVEETTVAETIEQPAEVAEPMVEQTEQVVTEQPVQTETAPIESRAAIDDEVAITHAGNTVRGKVVGIDKDGNYKVREKDGTNYTVKPENLLDVVRSAKSAGLEAENKALISRVKDTLRTSIGKNTQDAKDAKKTAKKDVQKGVIGTQQLADIPNRLFQNKVAEKVRGFEDYIAKTIQQASVSNNKALRNIADFVTSYSRGIVDTQAYSTAKRQILSGTIGETKLEVQEMTADLWDLIGGDIEAADRVHQVLDPELRDTGLTFDQLTDNEKQLYNLLKDINAYTHNENFRLGKISEETYNKYKDKYIGREYDIEVEPEFVSLGKPLKEILNIYKQRTEVNEWKKEAAIKDPIYLTLRRMMQTGQNRAVNDYSNWLSENYSTGNAAGNVPLIFSAKEAKGKDGLVQLGKGFSELSHQYVARTVAEDFRGFMFNNQFVDTLYKGLKLYDGLPPRQWIKELLTVGNPQVQLGNFTSNTVFAWLGGVDMPTYLSKMPEAIKEIKNKGDVYKSLVKEGLIGNDFVSSDLKPMGLEPKDISDKFKGLKNIRKAARTLYGGADDAAKIQMYLSLKDMGYTDAEAYNTIFEALQNYQNTGRIWDFASKTPIIGNSFVKFTPEMLRLIKNGLTRRPLHTMAFLSLLHSIPKVIGKYLGDDDDEIDAAARMKGIPKLSIPYTDVSLPLSWRIGDKRVNIARYLMPMYMYDIGGEDKKATEFFNKFSPFQLEQTETGGLTFYKIQDPFAGTVLSALANKDFRGKQIREDTDSKGEKVLNTVRYVLRGYGGFYAQTFDDVLSEQLTGEDFYGRRKKLEDIAMGTIIKIETFTDGKLKEGIQKEYNGYEYAVKKLYEGYTKKRKALQSEVISISNDDAYTEAEREQRIARKELELQGIAETVLENIADIEEQRIKATEFYRNLSRNAKYEDLESTFAETEDNIYKIQNRVDGVFKE